jgi:hypothetical protein
MIIVKAVKVHRLLLENISATSNLLTQTALKKEKGFKYTGFAEISIVQDGLDFVNDTVTFVIKLNRYKKPRFIK